MNTVGIWLRAARLRTLPLSIAGILAGTALANAYGYHDSILFLLTLATTLAFQITSNFANDYGDGVKGTDNERRIGPQRVLQSGRMSRQTLKKGVMTAAIVSGLLTVATLYRAFGTAHIGYSLLFLALGALAIWAAIRYTVGRNAYGYSGKGDVFVFLFFGLLSVLGTFFLYAQRLMVETLPVAICIGALSVAVLNLNNLRDMESDRESGKNTLVVKVGFRAGIRYHFLLCITALLCLLVYIGLQPDYSPGLLALLPFIPIGFHLRRVWTAGRPEALDPELKIVALSTFFIGLILYISNNYFL